MRKLSLYLLAFSCCFHASCAKKDEPQGDATGKKTIVNAAEGAPTAEKPIVLPKLGDDAEGAPCLFGTWQLAKDNDKAKRLAWPVLKDEVAANETLYLKLFKGGLMVMGTTPDRGVGMTFKMSDNNRVEITFAIFRNGIPPLPPPTLSLKAKVVGDDLTLSDDMGNQESYKRLPAKPVAIKIENLPLYSEKCAATLKEAFTKVPSVSRLVIDSKERSASLICRDEDESSDINDAIRSVGMDGSNATFNGKQSLRFWPSPETPGRNREAAMNKEIILDNVHACCAECQKVIAEQCKDAKVKFEGERPTRTLRISGDKLDAENILLRLRKAGFRVN